jgi:hypothetical protein
MSHLIELNDAGMNWVTSSEPRPIWGHWVAVYTLNWDHLTWLCGVGPQCPCGFLSASGREPVQSAWILGFL